MNLPFKVAVERLENAVLVINIAGELDQATVPELEGALDDAIANASESLLVDLSECSFIDSSGLAALVAARQRVLDSDGRGFGLCCPDEQVRRLLNITGLDNAMGVTGTRDEALSALTSSNGDSSPAAG